MKILILSLTLFAISNLSFASSGNPITIIPPSQGGSSCTPQGTVPDANGCIFWSCTGSTGYWVCANRN